MVPGRHVSQPNTQAMAWQPQTVDDLRKKVMGAAGVIRPYDPEVYPRITLRLHGVEIIELFVHNPPTGEVAGWYEFQHCLDSFLPLYKKEDEKHKIVSRSLARLGREITEDMVSSVSSEDRKILLMSNKEYAVKASALKKAAPVTIKSTGVSTRVESASVEVEQAAKIRQLEAMIMALSSREDSTGKNIPVPPQEVSWADEVERCSPPVGSPPDPNRVPPKPSGSGANRRIPPIPTTNRD